MPNWKDLPAELQEMVVRRSTLNTRKSLQACSKRQKELVEESRINSIDELKIGFRDNMFGYDKTGNWCIQVHKFTQEYPSPGPDFYEYNTYAEFQNKLFSILKAATCVRMLYINKLNNAVPLELVPPGSQSKLRLEYLKLDLEDASQHEHILSQIESGYLRKIFLKTDDRNTRIYDTIQVRRAESLTVASLSYIDVHQLMKLEAREISFEDIAVTIISFVKKCAREGASKFPKLFFGGLSAYAEVRRMRSPSTGEILLDTDHPELKFQVVPSTEEIKLEHITYTEYYVKCDIRFESELSAATFSRRDPSVFRKIEQLLISYEPKTKTWSVAVERETHNEYELKFNSLTEIQEKLREIFANTDYIKLFKIKDLYENDEPMRWHTIDKQLLVGKLEILGDHSKTCIRELLDKIDHVYLKFLKIHSKDKDDDILNLTQVRNANYFEMNGTAMQDEQLLNLKCETFMCSDSFVTSHNILLTANGLNQYIKFCFADSVGKCHSFLIRRLADELNENELFRDLITLKQHTPHGGGVQKLVTMKGSNLIMHLIHSNNILVGAVQKRREPFNNPAMFSCLFLHDIEEFDL